MATIRSMMRMIRVSTRPPNEAAVSPSATPMTVETTITDRPMNSEMRAPWMMRESMSRPTASVPSGKAQSPPSIQTGGIFT